jgi:replication factor A2
MSFFLQTQGTTTGGSMFDLCQRLRGVANEDTVREQLEILVNEGHLYNTVDDDHFKTTGS